MHPLISLKIIVCTSKFLGKTRKSWHIYSECSLFPLLMIQCTFWISYSRNHLVTTFNERNSFGHVISMIITLVSFNLTLDCCTSGLQRALESVPRCSMQHLKTTFDMSLMAFTMRSKLLTLQRWTWKWLETVLNEQSLFNLFNLFSLRGKPASILNTYELV